MPGRVGLVDYGAGNFASVRNALEHVGCAVEPVATPEQLRRQERVVLPGVGAFAACMRRLEERSLVSPLQELIAEGEVPFLGICVGMQLLATAGLEFGRTPGLGAVPGDVRPIDARGMRLPHMGWNTVRPTRSCPLFEGVGAEPTYYFVHSYHLVPEDPAATVAVCDYGGDVTAAVGTGNAYGVQFHPEKSQQAGLRLLRNFSELGARRPLGSGRSGAQD